MALSFLFDEALAYASGLHRDQGTLWSFRALCPELGLHGPRRLAEEFERTVLELERLAHTPAA